MPEENQSRTVPLLDNIRDYTLLYNYVNAFRQIQLESGDIYERISENERKNGVTFNPKSLTVKGMVELIHKYPSITNIGTANQKKLAQLHNYATSISSDFPTTDQIDAEKARYESVMHQRDIDTAQAVEARAQELKGLKKNHRKSGRKLVGAVVLGVLGAVLTAGIVGAFGTAVFGLITNAVTLGAGITSGLAVGGLVVGIVGGRLLFNGLSKMFSKIRSRFGKAREDWRGTRAKLRDAKKEYRKEKAQRRLAERAIAFDNAYSREPYPGRNLFNANEYNNARNLNMQEMPHIEPTPEEQAELEETRRRIAEQEARRNAGRQRQQGNDQNLENSEEELTGEEPEEQQTGEQNESESEGGQQGGEQPGRETEAEPIVVGGGRSRGPVLDEEIVEELDDDEEEELNRVLNNETNEENNETNEENNEENATEVAPVYNFANMDTDDIYSDIQDMQKEDERLGRRLSRTKSADKQEQFTNARKENEEKLNAYKEELGKRTITPKIASALYEDQEVTPKDLESIEEDKEEAPRISSREIRRIMKEAEANAQALDNELKTNNRLTVNEYRERVQKRNAYNYFAAEMENELSARTAFEEFKYGEQGMALRRALDGAGNEYLEALIGDFARNMPKVARAMEANGTGGTVWGAGERLDDQAIEYITKLGESNFGQQLVAELLEERKLTAGVDTAKVFELRNEALQEYNSLKGAPNVDSIELAKAESEFRMYDRELDTRDLEADKDTIATGMQDKGNWDRDAYASQVTAVNEEINKKETVGVLETEVEDTVITLRKKKERAETMLKEVQEKTTIQTPDGGKVETVPNGVKFSEYEGALVVRETIMQNIQSLDSQIAEIENANREEIERRIAEAKKIQVALMVNPDALTWVGVPAPEVAMGRAFKEEKAITPEQAKAYLDEFEKTGILPEFDGLDADPEFRALAEQIRINSFGRTPSADGVNVKKSLEELGKEQEIEESRVELENIKTKVAGWREQAVKDGLIAEEDKNDQGLFVIANNQAALDAGYPDDVQISRLIGRARVLLGRVVPYDQQKKHTGLDGETHIATKEGLEKAVEAFTSFLREKANVLENAEEEIVEILPTQDEQERENNLENSETEQNETEATDTAEAEQTETEATDTAEPEQTENEATVEAENTEIEPTETAETEQTEAEATDTAETEQTEAEATVEAENTEVESTETAEAEQTEAEATDTAEPEQTETEATQTEAVAEEEAEQTEEEPAQEIKLGIALDSLAHRNNRREEEMSVFSAYGPALGETATIEDAQKFLEALDRGEIIELDRIEARPDFAEILDTIKVNMVGRPGDKNYNIQKAIQFYEDEVAKADKYEAKRVEAGKKLQEARQKAVDAGLVEKERLNEEGFCPVAANQAAIDAGYPTWEQSNELFIQLIEAEEKLQAIEDNTTHKDRNGVVHKGSKDALVSAVEEAKHYLRSFIMEKQVLGAENAVDQDKEDQENALQALIRKARGFIAPIVGRKKPKKKGQTPENTPQSRAEQIITKDMLRMQFVAKFKKGNEKGKVTGDILGARREMIDAMLGALRMSEKTSGIKEEDFIPKEILEEMVDEFINETKEFKGKWHNLVQEKEAELNASRENAPEVQAENQPEAVEEKKPEEDAENVEILPVAEEEEKRRKSTQGLNIEVSSRMSIKEEGFVFHRGEVSFVIPHEKMVVVDNDIKAMREAGKTEQQIIEKLAGDYKNKFAYEGRTKKIVQGQKNFAQVVKSYDERQEAIKNIENASEEDDLQQVVDAGEAKRLEEARREEEAREREAQEEARRQAEEAKRQAEEAERQAEEARRQAQEEAERRVQEEAAKAQKEELANSNLASRMTVSQDGFEFKNNKGKTFVVPYSKMENIAKTIEVLETKEWGGNREEQIAKRLTGTKGISTGIKYRREDGEIVRQGSVTGFENFEQIYKTYGSQKAEIMQAIEEDKLRQAEAQKAREAEAERKAEEARRQAEEVKRQAEEEARRQAERQAEEARRQAEEEARRQAEEANRQAEEEARRQAEETKRQAEEEARRQAEEARRQAEEEARRQAEETKRQAEEEARRQAEETQHQAEQPAKKQKSAKLQAVEEQLRAHYENGGKLSQQQFDKALFEAGLTADDTLLAQGIYQGLEAQRQETIKQQKIENLRRAREEKAQQNPEVQEDNKPKQNPENKSSNNNNNNNNNNNDDNQEMGAE
ncbi:MAG: hypothetical protein IKC11_00115 [Clostridia bacterium]|nr:hypothetical protein [Clostridia bacterium]